MRPSPMSAQTVDTPLGRSTSVKREQFADAFFRHKDVKDTNTVQRHYFSDRSSLLKCYLERLLGQVTVIEPHQTQFLEEFCQFTESNNIRAPAYTRWDVCASRTVSGYESGSVAINELLTHHIVYMPARRGSSDLQPTTAEGYFAFQIGDMISWVIHFLLQGREPYSERERAFSAAAHHKANHREDRRFRYRSILDIPRSFLGPIYDHELRNLLPLFSRSFVQYVMEHDSVDASAWWESKTGLQDLFFCSFFPYHYVESLVDDRYGHTATNRTDAPVGDLSLNYFAKSCERFMLRKMQDNSARIGLSCYLYLCYAFIHPSLSCERLSGNERSKLPQWQPGDAIHTLFETMFAMVACRQLDINNHALVHLYTRDNGHTLRFLSSLAEDVRTALIYTEPLPNTAKNLLLARISERSEALVSGTSLLREACRRSLGDAEHAGLRHQVNVRLRRESFVQLVHSLERHPLERDRFRTWLATSKTFHVRYNDVLMAECLTTRGPERPPESAPQAAQNDYRNELQSRGENLIKHIQDCEKTMVVLRFPPNVCIEEVRLSLEYYYAIFPYLDGNGLFCGLDSDGVFLVAEHRQHAIISQAMFVVSTTTRKSFRHNIPLFPILARFYFTNHSPSEHSRTSKSPRMEDEAHPPIDVNDHALHCVATVLAHWLDLPTSSPSDMLVSLDKHGETQLPSRRRRAGNHGEFTQTTASKRRANPLDPSLAFVYRNSEGNVTISDPLVATAPFYVPEYNDELFPCMALLHRFAARLEEAIDKPLEKADKLTDGMAEALAGYLEMKRPRHMTVEVAVGLVSVLKHRDPEFAEDLSGLIDAARLQCNSIGLAKKPRGEVDVPLHHVVINSPWPIYAAAIDGAFSRDMFHCLFLGGGLYPVGRELVKCANLRTSKTIHDESDADRQLTRTIVGSYNQMFVVPYSPSVRSIRPEFAKRHEPVEPLGHLMRLLEMHVAPRTLANSLSGSPPGGVSALAVDKQLEREAPTVFVMDNAASAALAKRFDFSALLGARSSLVVPATEKVDRTLEDAESLDLPLERVRLLRELRSRAPPRSALGDRLELMSSDGRSMLPIQHWPSRDGERPTTASHTIIYLESFFTLVAFPGGTYANHLMEHGIGEKRAANDAFEDTLIRSKQHLDSDADIRYSPAMATTVRIPINGRVTSNGSLSSISEDDTSQVPLEKALYFQEEVSEEDGRITRARLRAQRHRFVATLNLVTHYAQCFFFTPGGSSRPHAHETLYRFEAELRQRSITSINYLDQNAQREVLTQGSLYLDWRAFPVRFKNHLDMYSFIMELLCRQMHGESPQSHRARLHKHSMNRQVPHQRLFQFMLRLYAVCGHPLDDSVSELKARPYDPDPLRTIDTEANRTESFLAILQEAIRRGLVHRLARADKHKGRDVDPKEIDKYFEDASRDLS